MYAYIPREMREIIYLYIIQSINTKAIPMLLQRYVLVLVLVVVSNAFQTEDCDAHILLGTCL